MGKPGETKLESYRYNSPVTSRFFSKFLFPRNTVTNIFKPNLIQTFLGRRKRDVDTARMLNFQLEDQQWLGESYNLHASPHHTGVLCILLPRNYHYLWRLQSNSAARRLEHFQLIVMTCALHCHCALVFPQVSRMPWIINLPQKIFSKLSFWSRNSFNSVLSWHSTAKHHGRSSELHSRRGNLH